MSKLKSKLAIALKHALTALKKLIPLKLGVAIILYGAWLLINSEQFQRYYLRKTVGSKVVKIVKLDANGNVRGGGTGFAIKAPSGQSYLMTNSHVCAIAENGEVNVQLSNGTIMGRRVVRDSENTDLCLLEGVPGVEGIELADGYGMGDIASVVGHPSLMPLTVSKGEIIGKGWEDVGLFEIMSEDDAKRCNLPKHRIIDAGFWGAVCVEHVVALQTTIVGLPGNSGSPVVNQYGHIVGVLFAGDNRVHWSLLIPLEEVKRLLLPY